MSHPFDVSILMYFSQYVWTSLVAQMVKNLSAM